MKIHSITMEGTREEFMALQSEMYDMGNKYGALQIRMQLNDKKVNRIEFEGTTVLKLSTQLELLEEFLRNEY